jgi:type III pantothenate kinase
VILTVDIGNSRVKWASWENEKIIARGVAPYALEEIPETFDELFSTLKKIGSEKPSSVYAVCVAGEAMAQALSDWVTRQWQLEVGYLETQKQFKNIINVYEKPEQHGVDRWAAVVASHQANPGYSVCVISAGTAITVDLINKSGQHLGGYILPSFMTMHAALLADTANVESTSCMQFHKNSVPDNTSDAVNQGLHKMLQAGIRDLCQFAKNRMDNPMRIVLTGGFAETILDYPDMPAMLHKPDLVMDGLYGIMQTTEDSSN